MKAFKNTRLPRSYNVYNMYSYFQLPLIETSQPFAFSRDGKQRDKKRKEKRHGVCFACPAAYCLSPPSSCIPLYVYSTHPVRCLIRSLRPSDLDDWGGMHAAFFVCLRMRVFSWEGGRMGRRPTKKNCVHTNMHIALMHTQNMV